ncbi:MAG TPA: hypothetical protein PK185_18270 [Cyclobacteriaceae bacterium]|nr:hypothetical protein [Cyclobacteriaceae bacterium]
MEKIILVISNFVLLIIGSLLINHLISRAVLDNIFIVSQSIYLGAYLIPFLVRALTKKEKNAAIKTHFIFSFKLKILGLICFIGYLSIFKFYEKDNFFFLFGGTFIS